MDTSNREMIEMVNTFWSDGKLKQSLNPWNESNKHFLTIEFLSKDQQVISTSKVTNPLKALVEEYSPDGSISRKEAKVSSAYFTVRAEVSTNVVQMLIRSDTGQFLNLFPLK